MGSFSSNDITRDPQLSSALLWEIQLKWNQLLTSSYSISKIQEKIRFEGSALALNTVYVKCEGKKRASFETSKLEDEGPHTFGDDTAAFTVSFLIWILAKSAVIRIATKQWIDNNI